MKIYIPILLTIMFILNVSCEQMHSIGEKKVEAKNNTETPLDTARKYNNIAAEFIRNARTTGDFSLNSNAQSSVKKALEIEPENFESKKLQASLHLTFHSFEEALKLGTELQKEAPEDAFVYGVLTDANVELGNYKAAVSSVQKMVDLKPNFSSYTRVAHVRSLHGDSEGAIESFTTAAKIADPADIEAQAWCFTNLGNEQFNIGKYVEAEKSFDTALKILPQYPAGMVGKAKILANQGNLENAIAFYTNAQNKSPLPETVIELGNIYAKLNNSEKAKQQYELAEVIEQTAGNTDQRRLALLWADNDEKLTEALEIATKEHSLRKDIFTADIFAWCLYKNGKFEEAKVAIAEAMRLNTKDARFFYHAGMIEKELGNKKEAKRLLKLALQTNSAFDILQAEKAKIALEEI